MSDFLQWIYPLFDHGMTLFLLLFSLGLINAFLPPIPIESVTVVGSFFTAAGYGNLFVIWLAPSFGMFFGNLLLFLIVRMKKELLFRSKIIKKHITPEYMDKSHDWFERYGAWAIIASRLIPWMTFAMVFYAGLTKMALHRILPIILISNLLYFGGLVLIGRFAKEEWELIMELIKPILSWAGFILVLCAGISYLIWRMKRSKE